ncbi:MAG TPA: hypothetical protein DCW73_07180 [Treponema sp.]|nr:hypothetical protein [Treponema sp.]
MPVAPPRSRLIFALLLFIASVIAVRLSAVIVPAMVTVCSSLLLKLLIAEIASAAVIPHFA